MSQRLLLGIGFTYDHNDNLCGDGRCNRVSDGRMEHFAVDLFQKLVHGRTLTGRAQISAMREADHHPLASASRRSSVATACTTVVT